MVLQAPHTMLKAIVHARFRTEMMLHTHNSRPDVSACYSLPHCDELLAVAERLGVNTDVAALPDCCKNMRLITVVQESLHKKVD